MDLQMGVHQDNGTLFNDGEEWAVQPYEDMDGSWRHSEKWKKVAWMVTYCMIPFILCSGKGKTVQNINRWVVSRGWAGGGLDRRSTGGCFRTLTLLCRIPQWWIHNTMHLSKPVELHYKQRTLMYTAKKSRGSWDPRTESRVWGI